MLARLGAGSERAAPACAGAAGCGTLWVYDGSAIRGVTVRTGITNGTAIEILDAPVDKGTAVVSAVTFPAGTSQTVTSAASASSTSRSPLLGSSPPPRPPGGMGGPPR